MSKHQADLVETLRSLGIKVDQISSTPGEVHFQLSLKAKPQARKSELKVLPEGQILVAVNEAPTEGAANQAIIKFLAKSFGLAPSQISLVSGEKARLKKVQLGIIFTKHKDQYYYIKKLHECFVE